MNFGQAIEAAKNGELIKRQGWNGKGMFVFLRPGDSIQHGIIPQIKSLPQKVKDWFDEQEQLDGVDIRFTAYLCMKASDDSIVNGWLASQTDMLAEDWSILEI